jgi:AcrR family transcriptional regulator
MSAQRGDAAATRQAILTAARELFAAHGVNGVSVRAIAAAAGVNHALVHRYFGAKGDMVEAILASEAEAMSSMGRPDLDAGESLVALRDVLEHVLTGRRTTLLLMLRAEIDGLTPERLLDGAAARPLGMLESWLAVHGGSGGAEPRALAMVLGAAIMGLAALQPMLTVGAGLEDEDPDEVRRRCIEVIVGVAASAIGITPPGLPGVGDTPADQTGGVES